MIFKICITKIDLNWRFCIKIVTVHVLNASYQYKRQFAIRKLVKIYLNIGSRGRCCDHNFLRFSPIFCEKIGVFLKNQCNDQNFA
jgi:hypothetical protein